MKSLLKYTGFIAASFLVSQLIAPYSSNASSNSKIDYSHLRILAFSISQSSTPSTIANGSGYLYSPRIVLTAGHFQDAPLGANFFALQNNSRLTFELQSAKVIKTFYPQNYDKKSLANDFAVYVLEKPLAQVSTAKLATPEIIETVIKNKAIPVVTGYGAFQALCKSSNPQPNCSSGENFQTSSEPRSIQMSLLSYEQLKDKYGTNLSFLNEVSDHLFFESDFDTSPCPGDSGGATTVTIEGTEYYVGTTPTGFWYGSNCGATPGSGLQITLGYTAPVFKFLNLIQQAQNFVDSNPVLASTPTKTNQNKTVPKEQKKNSVIFCTKDKTTIKIKKTSQICPKGFKKKLI
ncbi:MAG: trypsin-like serine protease [Candidatus Planktophila sp.]